jgi:hypothetical protein
MATKAELQEQARAAGLSTDGTKTELEERLANAEAAPEAGVEADETSLEAAAERRERDAKAYGKDVDHEATIDQDEGAVTAETIPNPAEIAATRPDEGPVPDGADYGPEKERELETREERLEARADRVAHKPRTKGNNPVAEFHERVVDRDRTVYDAHAVEYADGVDTADDLAVVEQHVTIDVLPDATKPGADGSTEPERRARLRSGEKVEKANSVTFRYIGSQPRLVGREVSVNEGTVTHTRLLEERDWERA